MPVNDIEQSFSLDKTLDKKLSYYGDRPRAGEIINSCWRSSDGSCFGSNREFITLTAGCL